MTRKVRLTIFYENNARQITIKIGDTKRIPGYFGSYGGKDGMPRAIMLCRDRKKKGSLNRERNEKP